jgi:Class III cytochrome C family
MRYAIGVVAAAMLIVLYLGWVPVRAEDEMRVPMGEIVLKPLTVEAKRSPVTFPHADHFDYNCRQCHHKWNKEMPIGSCSTEGCHDFTQAPKNDEGRPVSDAAIQIRYYKNAFHQMCIGCHLQIAKNNEALQASRLPGTIRIAPAGPTGCIQCHPKE